MENHGHPVVEPNRHPNLLRKITATNPDKRIITLIFCFFWGGGRGRGGLFVIY